MRHLPNSLDLNEITRVLDLIQQDVDRKTSTGTRQGSADALTKAGAAQAQYGSAGVLLTQLAELAKSGAINSGLLNIAPGDNIRPPANTLVPPTITPKLTRHGELTLAANGTDLELDSRGYATTTSRLIREVP